MNRKRSAERIRADSPIQDVVGRYPQAVGIFVQHGLQCAGCYISPFHTIADTAREYGMDVDLLLTDLNRAIAPGTELAGGRIAREWETVEAMIVIYCRALHRSRALHRGRAQHQTAQGLCQECQELADYARQRLQRCPFQENKTTCANCTVHCYKPAMRERIRAVMRYAGPRMIYRHPLLALHHLIEGRKKP